MTPNPDWWGVQPMSEERQQIRSGMYYNTTPLINIFYLDEGPFGIGYYRQNEAFFSNCGTYLAGINTTLSYDGGNLVNFYRNGSLIRSYGWRDFSGDRREWNEVLSDSRNNFSLTPGGFFWDEWEARELDAYNNVLTIVTLDGSVFTFDITTGDIISHTSPINFHTVLVICFAIVAGYIIIGRIRKTWLK